MSGHDATAAPPRLLTGPRRSLLSRRRRRLSEVGRYAVLTFFLFVFLAPLYWIAMAAFKTRDELAADPFGLPASWGGANFSRAWEVGSFNAYLPNTVIYSLAITFGVCVLSCLGGYALARFRLPGNRVIVLLLLVAIVVPFQSVMIPLFSLVETLGLQGTHLALILPIVAREVPFGIFIMRSFFQSLPEDLASAGRVDGASEWQVFRRVMLPLAFPGVATVAVFQSVFTWTLLLEPLILVPQEELRPVAVGLSFFTGQYSTDRPVLAAAVMISIVPLLLVSVLLQRRFVQGVTAGALK